MAPRMRPTSPTVKRRHIALTLRRLREERTQLTAAEASKSVDKNSSWLSKVELAQVRPGVNDVAALLRLYGIDGPAADAVLQVTREAGQKGWWRPYDEIMPDWFVKYVGLESAAATLRTYECQMVPGLLQTEDYARAAIRHAPTCETGTTNQVEQQIELRMERQRILDSDDPPQLIVVLDEGALRRLVGGPATMREQCDRLIEASDRPNVELQVVEFDQGVGFDGSFVILDFPPPPDPFPLGPIDDRVVYVDTLAGALYLDRPGQLAAYADVFESLRAQALPARKSRDLLRSIAKALTS